MSDEGMHYDVVIVGAGPAGLSAAIRLKQLAHLNQKDLSVCVLEKGSSIGAHSLSGAIFETRALDELIPDWKEKGAPVRTPVVSDAFYYATKTNAYKLPTPPQMHNAGNYIISLGELCGWLGQQAEALGVELYSGFAAATPLFEEGSLKGVQTGPMGLDKEGRETSLYQPGVCIYGRQVILAEGCRGSMTQEIIKKYNLDKDSDPQTYGLGIKEIWEVHPSKSKPGHVLHSIGWPLDQGTYGGSFLYHLDDNKVAVGFVVGLDYKNPTLSPFEEFQRFKHHPLLRTLFEDGKRLSYGARALNEGGLQSLPKLEFPGGVIVGCAAGFLNVPKIKGNHTAMKSGMLAADAIYAHLVDTIPVAYENAFKGSWAYEELYRVRNIRPGFKWGLWAGLFNAAFETYVTRGHSPWTLSHHADYRETQKIGDAQKIVYPKPDGKISFDRSSSVFLANLSHEESQPCHLILRDPSKAMDVNWAQYGSPEQYYCPAGVYEVVEDASGRRLQINGQNCVHCKTCDIKDPTQNIHWVTPEGGSGPNYVKM